MEKFVKHHKKKILFQEKITTLGLDHVKVSFGIYAFGIFLGVFVFMMETLTTFGGKMIYKLDL